MLKRLLKWLGIAIAVVALLGLIVVWPVLGVNPFEGGIDNLWLLTSNDVQLFVRFPPISSLSEEQLYDKLSADPPYDQLRNFRDDLVQLSRDIARDVNPQIPLGIVQIDLEKDFLTKEMSIGGTVHGDYKHPRFKNFVFVARIPFYARFLSALKRGFVREKIRDASFELMKGSYFRVTVAPNIGARLAPYRTPRGEPGSAVTFYLARIADCIVFSDEPLWIEHALTRGVNTLQADAWFESEFIKGQYVGGPRLEIFARHGLTVPLMWEHARRGERGPLNIVRALMPTDAMGEFSGSIGPDAETGDRMTFRFSNALNNEGYDKLPPHLRSMYEAEKGDTSIDFSADGIGRFIPDRRTLAAAVVHAKPSDLIAMVLDLVRPDELVELDQMTRDVSRRRRRNLPSFRRFLEDLTADLGSTHLVIVHRPSEYERERYDTFKDMNDEPLPEGALNFTLVSSIRDSVPPDKVRQKIFEALEYFKMNAAGVHKGGKFHLATLQVATGDEKFVKPAYGVLTGQRYVCFSTAVEDALAVYDTIENENARLINRQGFADMLADIPRNASAALLVDGATLKGVLWDRVRPYARRKMALTDKLMRLRRANTKMTDEEAAKWLKDRIYEQYGATRDQYLKDLAYLDPVDLLGMSWAFGVGADRKLVAGGLIRLRFVAE